MWNFHNLQVVDDARRFARSVYDITRGFPSEERFGLTAQLRRSAVSVGSNIVEGSARSSKGDFARFLDIAIASTAEAEFQLRLSVDLDFISSDAAQAPLNAAISLRKRLVALRRVVLDSEP